MHRPRAQILCVAACLALSGCAPFGLHRSARVLSPGVGELGLSFDVGRFLSSVPVGERTPEDLWQWLLLPGLEYRRGVADRTEVMVGVYPVGLRLGARFQLAAGESGAVAAEAGLTAAGMIDVTESPGSNYTVTFVPDANVLGGLKVGEGGEAHLALRYAFFPHKLAGRGLRHAVGATAGYLHTLERTSLGADATGWLSPTTGDALVLPGVAGAYRF